LIGFCQDLGERFERAAAFGVPALAFAIPLAFAGFTGAGLGDVVFPALADFFGGGFADELLAALVAAFALLGVRSPSTRSYRSI
jgi:hypothetical protein